MMYNIIAIICGFILGLYFGNHVVLSYLHAPDSNFVQNLIFNKNNIKYKLQPKIIT